METYIVRFYRRAQTPPHDVAGTVEHVESGDRTAFTGEGELLDRLLGRPAPFAHLDAAAADGRSRAAPDER